MGFGPVTKDYETFSKELIKIINNDCKLEKKYLNRIEKLFKFKDDKNCERVYEEITKL
jgi:CDP-glycerol glycerophosphotransferase (TagB/SpsB family)